MFIVDGLLVVAAVVALTKVVQKAVRGSPDTGYGGRAGPDYGLTPGEQARADDAALRPAEFQFDDVRTVRGATRTTQDELSAFNAEAAPAGPLLRLAAVWYTFAQLIDRFTFVTGLPGVGKTAVMLQFLAELCRKGFRTYRSFKLVCVDPTDAYYAALRSWTPPGVPFWDLSVSHEGSFGWDVCADVRTPEEVMAFRECFIEPVAAGPTDPFWPAKGAQVVSSLIEAFQHHGVDWNLHLMCRFLSDLPALAAYLEACPATRPFAAAELVDKLGVSILSVASSYTEKLFAAAALDGQCDRRLSMKAFNRAESGVLIVSMRQDLIPSMSPLVRAMLNTLVTDGLKRLVKKGDAATYIVVDEGVNIARLTGLEAIAGKARAAGFGLMVSATSIPGLVRAWTAERTNELVSLVNTWLTFAVDATTAAEFCRRCGNQEGLVTSRNSGTSSGGWSEGRTTAYQLRDAVVPGEVVSLPDPDNPRLPGVAHAFVTNNNSGTARVRVDLAAESAVLPPVEPCVPRERPSVRLARFTSYEMAELLGGEDFRPAMIKALGESPATSGTPSDPPGAADPRR